MISCVIPTRNEARNLPHVMRTLSWCDDVIVVDMESSDGTPHIARDLGARVIAVAARPNFNDSRRVGLEAATNEWILALDADEMVPVQLADTLCSLARQDAHDVVVIPRLNFKLGCQRKAGLWPDFQRRFYRKGAVAFVPAVHDYLVMRSDRIACLPPRSELALHHFNYIPVAEDIEKLNRYTTADVLSRGARASLLPAWIWLRTFGSLYVRRHGVAEGIPGLWWSAFRAFSDFVHRRKQLELMKHGTVEATAEQVADLNRETTERAEARLTRQETGHAVSLRRFVGQLLIGFHASGSLDVRAWQAACHAFCDLAVEMKVWECASGRAMAEYAQEEMRAVLAAQWAGDRFHRSPTRQRCSTFWP